jgi:hypothetical protein
MRLFAIFACFAMLTCLGTLPGHADRRVALVIGNSAYRNVAPLPNTVNDATDMAASFRRLGFSVNIVRNGGFDDLRRALLQFGRDAQGADMAVIYYAGHGMEIGGENWLIPVDAELRSDNDAESEAIALRAAMLQVSTATSLGLVILDSCRNNPFAAKMQRVSRYRAVDRGLARVEPADNVLVAYAAKDGTTASDGRGRNSPFTAALLNHVETPGLEIRFLLASVRDEVLTATNRQQQPFVYGSLSRQSIYLKLPEQPERIAGVPPRPGIVPQQLSEAERAWAVVQNSRNIAELEAFVRRYGDSFYADLGRVRIDELKKTQTAPPPAQNVVSSSSTPPSQVPPKNVSPSPASPCAGRSVTLLDPTLAEPCPPEMQAVVAPPIVPPISAGPLSECDRLAAAESEPILGLVGIGFDKLNPAQAGSGLPSRF